MFSRCVWQWERTNTVFSRDLGLWGTPFPFKLRSGCDFGRLGGSRWPGYANYTYFLVFFSYGYADLSSFVVFLGPDLANNDFDGDPFLTDFGVNFRLKID